MSGDALRDSIDVDRVLRDCQLGVTTAWRPNPREHAAYFASLGIQEWLSRWALHGYRRDAVPYFVGVGSYVIAMSAGDH